MNQYAGTLLTYIQKRHEHTVNSLHKIFKEAFTDLGQNLEKIILLEGTHLDWTSGLQLKALDVNGEDNMSFDEVWFNSNPPDMFMEKVDFRSYMWRRSRYMIDAFFQAVASATDSTKRTTTGIARWSPQHLSGELLRTRLLTAVNTADNSLTSLAALPPLKGTKEDQGEGDKKTKSQRTGFIGVAFLSEEEGKNFIDNLQIADSGAIDVDIMEAMRKLMPSKN